MADEGDLTNSRMSITHEANAARADVAAIAPEYSVHTALTGTTPEFQFSHPALTALEEEIASWEDSMYYNGTFITPPIQRVVRETDAARAGIEKLKDFVSSNPDLENTIGTLVADEELFETITADGNSEWLQEQLTSMVPSGSEGSEIPAEVREEVVAYLESQAGNPDFRDQLRTAIIEKDVGFFEDMQTSMTSVAIDAGLADFASKGEAQANLVRTIEANPSLTAAIDNLAITEPEKFGNLLESLSGGDVDPNDPEAVAQQLADLESSQMMLSNPVLAGQMTQIINNMADPNQDVNPEDLTALQAAAEQLQEVAADLGPVGMVFDSDNKFADAKADLENAYTKVGLTPQDANIAIEQAAVMMINDKLSTFDNFGDNINAGINTFIESFGKESFIGGFLVSTGLMSEEQLDGLVESLQQFVGELIGDLEWANLDILGEGIASVDGLYDWVEGAVGIDTSAARNAEPTQNPNPNTAEQPVLEDEEMLLSEDSGAEATIQHAAYRSPISEIGRSTSFDHHEGGEAGDVYGAAQQTASLNTSFGPSMAGTVTVMTPNEVTEVTRTAPSVAANNQMAFTA